MGRLACLPAPPPSREFASRLRRRRPYECVCQASKPQGMAVMTCFARGLGIAWITCTALVSFVQVALSAMREALQGFLLRMLVSLQALLCEVGGLGHGQAPCSS